MAKENNREPNYWVLVLANKNQANSHYNAQVIFDAQVKRKAWGLKEGCRNYDGIKKGDVCLLYIGSPYCCFAGYAIAAGKPDKFDKDKRDKYLDKVYKRKPKAGVEFSKVVRFHVQVPATLMIEDLDYIKNKSKWGLYFLGSVMPWEKVDHQKVLAVACMLNKKLAKVVKPTLESTIEASFSEVRGYLH